MRNWMAPVDMAPVDMAPDAGREAEAGPGAARLGTPHGSTWIPVQSICNPYGLVWNVIQVQSTWFCVNPGGIGMESSNSCCAAIIALVIAPMMPITSLNT